METFFALLALCEGHRWIPLTKGQWRGALMFSLIQAWGKRFSKQLIRRWFETPSRSLWRHCIAVPLRGKSIGHRWISHTKGPVIREFVLFYWFLSQTNWWTNIKFHVMRLWRDDTYVMPLCAWGSRQSPGTGGTMLAPWSCISPWSTWTTRSRITLGPWYTRGTSLTGFPSPVTGGTGRTGRSYWPSRFAGIAYRPRRPGWSRRSWNNTAIWTSFVSNMCNCMGFCVIFCMVNIWCTHIYI